MMPESNRPSMGFKLGAHPLSKATTLELLTRYRPDSEAWEDAFEPRSFPDPPAWRTSIGPAEAHPRPSSHKLILIGIVVGAGANALGYLMAAWLL